MKFTAHQYRIPFKYPFKTIRTIFNHREGIILRLQDQHITAYGEAAPLPGFSPESLQQVIDQLGRYHKTIRNLLKTGGDIEALNHFYIEHDIYPSLRFALDTLAHDYQARQHQRPLFKYLFDRVSTQIPVNAVISIESEEQTIEKAALKIQEGFSTLKLKVGQHFEDELGILKRLHQRFPFLTIRIDANRAWQPQEAIRNLNQLAGLSIEYCEEPLKRPTAKQFKKIGTYSDIPIALDETLLETNNLQLMAPYISVLVLKPMLIGSLTDFFAITRLAAIYNNTIICTTALESGIARMMTATLAAGLGSKKTAHGLATGSLLTMDVWQDGTYINNGNFTLPNLPGLGQGNIPILKDIAEIIDFHSGTE